MIVAVLSAPRSGSSLVAGLLHHLGVPMGGDLLPPDRWNQLGYFEDRGFRSLHRAMTFPHGDDARAELRLPSPEPEPRPSLVKRYKEAVRHRARDGHWGLKEHRLAFVFDHFLNALFDYEVSQLVVVRCTRKLWARQESLGAMFGMSQDDAAEACAAYDARIESLAGSLSPFAAAGRCGDFDYDEAVEDPPGTLARLCELTGTEPTRAAKAFIDPRMRRFA